MKLATKHIQHCTLHCRYVATLPWEIKIFKFSAHIQQIWKKMQKNCILSAAILIPLRMQLCMLSVFMCFYQNLVLIAEYHVDCRYTLQ